MRIMRARRRNISYITWLEDNGEILVQECVLLVAGDTHGEEACDGRLPGIASVAARRNKDASTIQPNRLPLLIA